PLSVYARSKADAEAIVKQGSSDNWSIVRTIIVYGTGHNLSRNNIVCWAKEALKAGQEMNIVDDQLRAPTWADDLAWVCLRICELNEKGIYHISGPETMSVYRIVERIAEYYGLSKDKLIKVSSATLKQPAPRPPKTGFDLSKARRVLGYKPKTLEETLDLI
ncbi:MAG: SDR family oxidoreductase, partial [Flavobacteriales bacterium]